MKQKQLRNSMTKMYQLFIFRRLDLDYYSGLIFNSLVTQYSFSIIHQGLPRDPPALYYSSFKSNEYMNYNYKLQFRKLWIGSTISRLIKLTGIFGSLAMCSLAIADLCQIDTCQCRDFLPQLTSIIGFTIYTQRSDKGDEQCSLATTNRQTINVNSPFGELS